MEKDPFEDKISLYEARQMLMDYENTHLLFESTRERDNTEYACLTIFGFNVEKMLKYTADEHVAYAEEKATKVFDRLIGEKFGFKLKMTEDNIKKQ
ncbi:hypothetical protein MKW92_018639 [Papaver armeniacum]|nr:hypothetical protein MKW92_018639 [Papaver armeniacum]